MKKKLLILVSISITLFADFSRDNTTQIVTDRETGLQWQDDIDAKKKFIHWPQAIEYCSELTLGGYDDWRLPNINELLSILDDTKSPLISPVFQNLGTSFADYWSSTTYPRYNGAAVVFNFYHYWSQSGGSKTYNSNYVRCVRGGD